jgi:hypothetical protein
MLYGAEKRRHHFLSSVRTLELPSVNRHLHHSQKYSRASNPNAPRCAICFWSIQASFTSIYCFQRHPQKCFRSFNRAIKKKDRFSLERPPCRGRLVNTCCGLQVQTELHRLSNQLLPRGLLSACLGIGEARLSGDLQALGDYLASLLHARQWKGVLTSGSVQGRDSEVEYPKCTIETHAIMLRMYILHITENKRVSQCGNEHSSAQVGSHAILLQAFCNSKTNRGQGSNIEIHNV